MAVNGFTVDATTVPDGLTEDEAFSVYEAAELCAVQRFLAAQKRPQRHCAACDVAQRD
jgi:hypothetical protein